MLIRRPACKVPAVLLMACGWAVAQGQSGGQPPAEPPSVDERISALTREVAELRSLVLELKSQLAAQPNGTLHATPQLAQATAPGAAPVAPVTASAAPAGPVAPAANAPVAQGVAAGAREQPKATADFLRGLTINGTLDGYYEYNTNNPIGRVNYLRAYDVSSNSFSLNQADLIVESAPDLAADKRAGVRLDLQYGQATSTLQGSAANELRPEVYRNVFQAYGTYVFPLGSGLTVDFGKWASSLGMEGNYTKDQLNYSRALWFDYLPFYHMGVRARYPINDEIAINAWVTNGTQQTEAFNDYKDQMLGLVVTPTPALSWTLNLYDGQEHPDVIYISNPTPAQKTLPNQQGTYFQPIANPPTGRLEIVDSYLIWQVTKALVLGAEGDYVQQRLYSYSSPQHVTGGAFYGGYRFTPRISIATRLEYLADSAGLYSGLAQYLKEGTFTLDYRPADDFLVRAEFRRDASNQRFFLSDTLGLLESSQQTVGFGLVWWFGQKEGVW